MDTGNYSLTHHYSNAPLRVAYSHSNALLVPPNPGDVGYDICSPIDFSIKPGEIYKLDTGIRLNIPKGLWGYIVEKSSVSAGNNKMPGQIARRAGIVDNDYTGNLIIALENHSTVEQFFTIGQKVVQILFLPVITPKLETIKVEQLEETERGSDGFGSTGSHRIISTSS